MRTTRGFMTFLLLCAFGAKGEVITGTVIIKRRLTKASVAPTIGLYERGPFVEAAKPSNDDPLVLERERVAVYLEGGTPAEESSATLSQSGRRFVPEMIVIPAGSSVSFPNLDPIFHNVSPCPNTRASISATTPREKREP